jgi:hypothetical protein
VPHQLEVWLLEQVRNVLLGTGEKIVHAKDIVPLGDKPVTEVRAKKATAASYQNSSHCNPLFCIGE